MDITLITAIDLAWMSGRWIGTIGEDMIEEHWSTPHGGTLMGMHRWLKNDEVYLYEFMAIEPDENNLVLKIKHFNRGLIGWEPKDQSTEFLFEHIGNREVWFLQRDTENFMRMIFKLDESEECLTITLQMDRNGHRKLIFNYKRFADDSLL